MGKSIRSRREYKCNSCKSPIRKGDLYYKKSVTVGSPSKITIDNSTGYPKWFNMATRSLIRFVRGVMFKLKTMTIEINNTANSDTITLTTTEGLNIENLINFLNNTEETKKLKLKETWEKAFNRW